MSSRARLAVQTIDVTKVYRAGHIDYPALRGVNLKIEKGELVSIVGPSGSGKSTLLNLIGALDPPTSGRVIIDGIDLRKLNQDKLALLRNLKIGFVYQSFNLIQRLTAIENVEMPLIARGIPEKIRKSRSLKMLSPMASSAVPAILPPYQGKSRNTRSCRYCPPGRVDLSQERER